jgi:hypothetical protein
MNETNGSEDQRTNETDECLNNFQKRFEHRLRDPKFALELAGFVVLCVYAAFTIRMYYANRDSADAAKESADTASRQLEMVDRPWIKEALRSVSDFSTQNGTITWGVSISANNVGHSVATEVFPDARLIAIRGADFIDFPRKQVTELCEKMTQRFKQLKTDPELWNNSIFPDDHHDFIPFTTLLLPQEIAASSLDGGSGLGKSVFPVLIGCIEYHYPTSPHAHHTGFVYVLSHTDDPSLAEPTRTFFSVGRTVPKDKIVLRQIGQVAD